VNLGSDLVVTNNPALNTISGFGALNAVSGNVDITGSFETIQFPSLAVVNGSFHVQSSKNLTCPDFSNVAIKGTFTCQGNVNNPQPLSNDKSSTDPSNLPNVSTPPSSSPTTSISSVSPTTTPSSSGSSLQVSGIIILEFTNSEYLLFLALAVVPFFI
jgi:hypothetical protein